MYFDIALREKEPCGGLTRNDVVDLFDMLNGTEAYPIDIQGGGESCAMGFITIEAAEKLDYNYTASGLNAFVSGILDDMSNESENCEYTFKCVKIWMSR